MPELLLERRDAVLLITLNRPHKLNAITHAMARDLAAALTAADADPDVRAICLTGAGDRAFSAGADLAALHHAGQVPPHGPDGTGFAGIATHPGATPLVAAVNGLAIGGGLEIVLACDLAVAADTARFGLPEVRHGLLAAGGGALRLPAQIPPRAALHMLLTGEPVDASTALGWGLVNELAPPDGILPRALELAARVAAQPPDAVAAARALVRAMPAWAATPSLWDRNDALLATTLTSPEARAATARYAR